MLINKKYILTYCSNIFKINNLDNIIYNVNKYIKHIKYSKNTSLCMSNHLSKKLKKYKYNSQIIAWQKNEKIYIPSLNGFVYQNFHNKNIKEKIYLPDWSSNSRYFFTKNLIKISTTLSNKNKDISISTLPISFKKWINKKDIPYILYKSTHNIINLIKNSITINNRTNKLIHIDIEPEPYCTIENYKNYEIFYKNWLIPMFNFHIKKNSKLENYIKLCYDICHFSVIFDKHKKIINKKKTLIGKIQLSSALKIIIPKNAFILKKLKKTLIKLKKSNFLHQCILKNYNNIEKYTDIKQIIEIINNKKNMELKIHCHVPIYKKKFKHMDTTYLDIKNVIKLLNTFKKTNHIEIETYTQHSLFKKINCINSIKKEYYFTTTTLK